MADPSADARAMLSLLAQSLAAQGPQRVQAEKQLEQLQQQPVTAAFLLALCEQVLVVPEAGNAAAVAQVDASLRLSACIWLKHYAKRSWKQARHWSDDERARLRHVLLLAALHEPTSPVAVQLALVVATIARGDFPGQWPFELLFSPMMQALQDAETPLLRRRRCIDVTYRLAKELATRRLLMHRKQFAMLGVELLPLVLQHWCATARVVDAPTTATEDHLGMLLTNTKLLSTLLLNAFRDLAMLQNGELVQATLVQFYEKLERFVALRHALPDAQLLDKICYRMASLVVGIQKAYPIEFRAYLTPFLTLFWSVLSLPADAPTSAPLPKRLQIEALQFIANVISCRLYKSESLSSAFTGDSASIVCKVITASGDATLSDAMVLEAQGAVDGFFALQDGTMTRLEKLLQLVVMHYMKLQPQDLEEWQSDPEAFVILSESLTAQESVRACAEDLFLTLLQTYPQQTIPVLTQLTTATSSWLTELVNGQATAARVLDVDAVLLAIGLGCYDLHECFDFEPWFLSHLVPLLINTTAGMGTVDGVPVLKYRVVWLVSCWLAQLSAGIRTPLYDALLSADAFFQSSDTDAALKLRIVQSLESMVNDWGFERVVFLPFLPRALECLYAFFPQTQESESKMKVLGCLEAILQACGADVVGVSEQISAPLPTMWNAGGEAENLVRGKILQLLVKLLSCVKECEPHVVTQHAAQVQTLHAMCLQVVRFATDVSNPDEVFLMENGLELWTETIEISPMYTEELHALFANAVRLMERDYEHVKLVLTLLELYIKLGQAQFWQSYHTSVASLLDSLVGNVKAEASILIARVVELLATSFPPDQLVGLVPVVKRMIDASLTYRQRHEDGVKAEPEIVVVAYLSVLARLLMQHVEFAFVQVLHRDLSALVALLDLMLDKFFGVVAASMAVRRRKIWAVGFCSLLDLTEPVILDRLGQILESCVDVMDEERELSDAKPIHDEEDAEERELGGGAGAYRAYQSYKKKKKLEQADQSGANASDAAVAALDLREHVRGKLNAIASRVGADVFAQMLQGVEASVVAKLQ